MEKGEMDKELQAMVGLSNAMHPFGDDDRAVVERILAWFNSKYGHVPQKAAAAARFEMGGDIQNTVGVNTKQFSNAAELFDAIDPKREYEKAITIGYWLQILKSQDGFAGMDVNRELKHMGHGISNITDAFDRAKEKKPALVVQTQKSGSSKQARKLYKLTHAGVRWVESRLNGSGATSETESELA